MSNLKKVVIIDDSAFMRMIIRRIIEEIGEYEVIGEASDGQKGIEVVAELHPDIITMDVVMPNLDGLNALSKIKNVSPNSKVIMVSSINNINIINEAINKGASDYLAKPVDKNDIIEVFNKVLKEEDL